MPRNGSGVYSKPANTTAISGQIISSTHYNTLMDDFADEITGSLPTDGTAPMTSGLKLADGAVGAPALKFNTAATTGIYKTSLGYGFGVAGTLIAEMTAAGLIQGAWTDLASATTTDLGSLPSQNIRVTGTTTITGLGTIGSGVCKLVRFAAALTLTYNGTSLILPGAANITTAAGDVAEFRSLGSGNWVCTSYQTQAGVPATSATTPYLITSGTAAAAATLDLTLPSGYRAFRLVISNFYPSSGAAVLAMRVSTDSGSSYKSGGTDYKYCYFGFNNTPSSAAGGGTTNSILVSSTASAGVAPSFANFDIYPGGASAYAATSFQTTGNDGTNFYSLIGGGQYTSTGTITNIRLLYSAGNITQMTYALYGIA